MELSVSHLWYQIFTLVENATVETEEVIYIWDSPLSLCGFFMLPTEFLFFSMDYEVEH